MLPLIRFRGLYLLYAYINCVITFLWYADLRVTLMRCRVIGKLKDRIGRNTGEQENLI